MRAIRLVAMVSGTANTATITAKTVMSSPVTESATPNAPPMAGSRPTGSISVVTARKPAIAKVRSAGAFCRTPCRVSVTSMLVVGIPRIYS